MYHDTPPLKMRRRIVLILCAVLCIAALLWGTWAGLGRLNADLEAQAAHSLKQTIVDAAVQCYAVEGSYPSSLAYLQTAYGVQIDSRRFIVTYDAFASNLLPNVSVLRKGS